MLLTRRRFVASSAAALTLPGCATVAPPAGAPAARAACLPPVRVDPSRVIRTLVGLRPYRAAGFVVREEALGDARIVHHYGHGGAGITLSWGTARLACDIGLPGHSGPVAVVGAGVIGLSTARLAQEAGFAVTLYAANLPPDTTSNVAGGQWSPFGHYREHAVTPAWRGQFAAALAYSWRRFQILVGEEYGIRWLPTYTETRAGDGSPDDPYHPGWRRLDDAENPFPFANTARFETLYVETGLYLRQLLRDFLRAGGRIERRTFAAAQEIAALPERLVFNCTGLGARALFGDEALRPARGQLEVLLPQPEVRYAVTGGPGYMFPRPDGILLGGTFQLDDWSTEPRAADSARILAAHARMFANLRCGA
jgi:D-amino-acid oxidase